MTIDATQEPTSRDFLGILIFFLTLALFFGARSNEFVQYDDDDYVLENPIVANGLTGDAIVRSFTESRAWMRAFGLVKPAPA